MPSKEAIETIKKKEAKSKENLLNILEKNLGKVTISCKKARISSRTYYNYMKDESFAEKVREINDQNLDFAELALLKQVNKGDTNAIKFYLSTQGKDRGYVIKKEVEAYGKDGKPLFHNPYKDLTDEELKEELERLERGS